MLGQLRFFAFVEVVKIEEQVHAGNTNKYHGDADAHESGFVQERHFNSEERESPRNQVNEKNPHSSHDHARSEFLGNGDDFRFVKEEHGKKEGHGEQDGVGYESVKSGGIDGGDSTNENAFKNGVEWSEYPRKLGFEAGDEYHHKSQNSRANEQCVVGVNESKCRKNQDNKTKNDGLVAGSLGCHELESAGNGFFAKGTLGALRHHFFAEHGVATRAEEIFTGHFRCVF